MLLAVLKKRKMVTLFENIQQQNKRPRLQLTSDSSNKEEITKDARTETNMDNPSIPNAAPSSQSHSSQSSLPDLIGEQNGGADCPYENDEEMPPLEGEDITEL